MCEDQAMTAQMIAKQSYLALGESISISIDQHCCYHVALTWESISHLVCPASLGFHDRSGDKKTWGWYSVIPAFLVCHKHSCQRDAKYSCHMFLIPERFGLWGYFAQEGTHYRAEGVRSPAANLHLQPLDKKVSQKDFLPQITHN